MAVPLFTSALVERFATDQPQYTTAGSISVEANRLVVIGIYNKALAGGTANAPTVTGAGMTWTQVGSQINVSNRMTILAGFTGGSSVSGQLTADFAGQTQEGFAISVAAIENTPLSGTTGLDDLLRVTGGNSGANAASYTLTFTGSWSGADNRFLAFYGMGSSRVISATSPYVTLNSANVGDASICAAYGRDADLNTITAQFTGTNAGWTAIGVEVIGLVVSGPPFQYPRTRTIGLNGRLD